MHPWDIYLFRVMVGMLPVYLWKLKMGDRFRKRARLKVLQLECIVFCNSGVMMKMLVCKMGVFSSHCIKVEVFCSIV